MREFMLVGHRGLSAVYPENTLVSFQNAIACGVDAIEFDVHLTRDGELVVAHDDELGRCCNGSGPVAEKTLAELRELDFGAWKGAEFAGTKIPTLNEVLDLALSLRPDLFLAVEIKPDNFECFRKTHAELKRRNKLNDCSWICLYANLLIEMKKYDDALKTHGFRPTEAYNFVPEAYDYMTRVGIRMRDITPEITKEFHDRGIGVDSWPVDNEEALDKALACNIDFMTSNAADVIMALLKKRGLR